MNEKTHFFKQFGAVLAQLAAALEDLDTLRRIAMARGYDQWSDQELAEIGKGRNDLLTLLYFADDTRSFLNNGTVEQSDRQSAIDRYRGDL